MRPCKGSWHVERRGTERWLNMETFRNKPKVSSKFFNTIVFYTETGSQSVQNKYHSKIILPIYLKLWMLKLWADNSKLSTDKFLVLWQQQAQISYKIAIRLMQQRENPHEPVSLVFINWKQVKCTSKNSLSKNPEMTTQSFDVQCPSSVLRPLFLSNFILIKVFLSML